MTARHFAALWLLLVATGCVTSEPTACDGFADRKLGITADEYRACAGEILEALDAVETPLRAIVSNKAEGDEREAARRAYAQLRVRIRRTGIEDDYRSMRPGTVIIKWPSGPVTAFNHAAFNAWIQFMSVMAYPSADNFAQGVRAHAEARRCYRAM